MLENAEKSGALRLMGNLLASSLLSLGVCSLPSLALAGYSKGGGFTAPGYGARAWGMAGAVVASGAGESSVSWNPALLTKIDGSILGLSYINLVPGKKAQQSFAVYARPLRRMPREEDGSKISRHAIGFLYGNLSLGLSEGKGYSENVFRVAYGYGIDYFLSLGFAASILLSHSDVEGFNSRGSTIDSGLSMRIAEKWNLGFVARNMFSLIMYSDGSDETLERRFTLAVSARLLGRLGVEGDVVFAHGGISRYAIGGELSGFSKTVFVRGGMLLLVSGEERAVPHFGMGTKFERFFLNYNANLDSEKAFEDTHRFSLSVGL